MEIGIAIIVVCVIAIAGLFVRLVYNEKECMYSKGNYTDEDRKVLCGGCEEECKFKPTTSVWHDASEMPKFSERLKDGTPITPWIIGSNYGHISPNAAHTYTMEQWETHIGFEEHREFKWAYEDELIKL